MIKVVWTCLICALTTMILKNFLLLKPLKFPLLLKKPGGVSEQDITDFLWIQVPGRKFRTQIPFSSVGLCCNNCQSQNFHNCCSMLFMSNKSQDIDTQNIFPKLYHFLWIFNLNSPKNKVSELQNLKVK